MELGLLYTSYFSLEWRFSYKKMEISIFHMKRWFFSYRNICVHCLLMFSRALNICMSTHMSLLPMFV